MLEQSKPDECINLIREDYKDLVDLEENTIFVIMSMLCMGLKFVDFTEGKKLYAEIKKIDKYDEKFDSSKISAKAVNASFSRYAVVDENGKILVQQKLKQQLSQFSFMLIYNSLMLFLKF